MVSKLIHISSPVAIYIKYLEIFDFVDPVGLNRNSIHSISMISLSVQDVALTHPIFKMSCLLRKTVKFAHNCSLESLNYDKLQIFELLTFK